MTLSLKSRFDLAPRRALFLSAHKAVIYHWNQGDIGSSYLFDTDEEGRNYFERYLRETPRSSVYIITDFFEEEYRQDTIPHVFGSDRNAIVQRKKGRLFRDTPYFHYRVIGREEEGRRDDKILLTAITNPGLVSAWIQLLDRHKVPLAGVYSLPLFTESILQLINSESDHVLVVSLQSISGLRQTFFHNKQFRISRLVQMPRYGTEPYAPFIRDEAEKIRRYLNSLRLTSPDESLEVYFFLTGDLLEEVREQHVNSGSVKYRFFDINDLLQQCGSLRRVTTPFSDQVFVHQLLKQKPVNYYASSSDRRYFTLQKIRLSMLAASALMLLGGAIWSGFNFMGGLGYKQNSLLAKNKSEFYESRYQIARERLPHTPVDPADLKVAVEIANKINDYKTSPIDMVRLISTGLNRFPSIMVNDLKWAASMDPNFDVNAGANAPPGTAAAAANASTPANPGFDFYQIAILDGHISQFNGDYREAISMINTFVETLRTRKNVYDIHILSLPLDISSDVNLQGSTNKEDKEARFSIKIILGISHEA